MYFLLPFKFISLNNNEVIVNEVGDFLIVPNGTSKRIIERKISVEEELYKDLHANFFISESKIPYLIDNYATRYRTKKAFLDNFTSLHIFVLTLRCNQNCQYCQASSKICNDLNFDISFKNLDYAIELMFSSPAPTITMEFQGGEPSIVPDKLLYSVRKAEELNQIYHKKITYVLCTNAINLSWIFR